MTIVVMISPLVYCEGNRRCKAGWNRREGSWDGRAAIVIIFTFFVHISLIDPIYTMIHFHLLFIWIQF